MEVGLHASDIPDARVYAARHRAELRNFKQALTGWTLLGLATLAVSLGLSEWRNYRWRTYHNRALAAMEAAIRGDARASLPKLAGLGDFTDQVYEDLFATAQEAGKKAQDRSQRVASCVSELEKIYARIQNADLAGLERDYAALEKLHDSAVAINNPFSFGLTSVDIQLGTLHDFWEKEWPQNQLRFRLDTQALEAPTELVLRTSKLHSDVKRQSAAYMFRAIRKDQECPIRMGAYGEKDDWVKTLPLDSKNIGVARYQLLEAMQSVLIALEIFGGMPEILHDDAESSQYNYEIGPGITLL